jgi:hypothetical protein
MLSGASSLSLQASRTDDQKNEAFRDKGYTIKLVIDVIDTGTKL